MSELTPIQSFYKDKTIFITGGSGLMGKVLIEKLLYSCSHLSKIYVLTRPKRGRTPEIRIDEMFKLPMFNRVRKEKPQVMKKVVPFQGDVTMDKMGLTDVQRSCLAAEVNIVFHCAATLKLESNLKDAISMNTDGTQRILDLSKQMKGLLAFVHLSTAFCHVDQEELREAIYDSPAEPEDIMRLCKWMNDDAIDLVTPKMIAPHPNTYTYSKRLAEKLVANEYPKLPCVVARPSIVTPCLKEPLPGWVDNLNGPVGLIVGGGKGVIRSMHCNANYHAEAVPCDLAINALIAIAYKIGTTKQRSESIPVYNITQSGMKPITWGEILDTGRRIAQAYPFENAVWYPDGDIRSSKFIHNLFVFFFHLIPAYLIDFLMLIFRQKRFMVRIQKKISDGLEVLQYFTTREWVFHNTNLLIMWGEMSPQDKKIFSVDFSEIDDEPYIKDVILGARQYCMKEPLSSLPRARMHIKMLYVIHIFFVYMFYFGVLYYTYKYFDTAKNCLDFAGEKIKSLPIVGHIVEKVHL